jgi:hypothetical protein
MSMRVARLWTIGALPILVGVGCTDGGKSATDSGSPPVDSDGDGFDAEDDCDDGDASIHPDAEEVCDEIDNDCDGVVDDSVTTDFYQDGDGDGFGDPAAVLAACAIPDGYAVAGDDCDDTSDETHPGAPERCDEADNDCDGVVDEDLAEIWYADNDADGFGDPADALDTCDPPTGYVANGDDCDDTADAAFPGGDEICDNLDNDCDGFTDEDDALDALTWFADVDGDGYGDATSSTTACTVPSGFVDDDQDCDDGNFDVRPDAQEVCDTVDNDCDALIDDLDDSVDTATGSAWYDDTDADGYGDAAAVTWACVSPSGTVADATDCDDTAVAVHPTATETCNSVDDDCDGLVDDADSGVDLSTGTSFYADTDADGYGDAAAATVACDTPSGHVSDATDCDDAAASVHPGATEVCNSVDDDCDGLVDDADSGVDMSTGSTYYADVDVDGFGDPAVSEVACDMPSGHVSDATDCDDGDGAIYPGAADAWYDGTDSDCGGDDDYDADADGYQSYIEAGGEDCADDDASLWSCGGAASSAGESCESILDSDSGLGDGAYWIDPDSAGAFLVDCDMTTDGGGWVELQLNDSDSALVYQYSTSNPWRKCADNGVKHFSWLATEGAVTVDGSVGYAVTDVSLTFLQPSTGTVYASTEVDGLRGMVTELSSTTRMVAITADDDGYSYQAGAAYGHEVYATDGSGTWTVLTTGTNGECGGATDRPSGGTQSAFYLWSTTAADSAVDGTTGVTSASLGGLDPALILPTQVRMVVYTGGGVVFGWEDETFLVR